MLAATSPITRASTVDEVVSAELYRKRWQVELFFKWIKQHLRIRSFYGRSENAVRVQIRPAICAYLMIAVVRKQLDLQNSLNEILQVLSVNIFEQTTLAELLAPTLWFQVQFAGDHHPQKALWPKE